MTGRDRKSWLRAFYFDRVYNPAYDLTVGHLGLYRRFLDTSVALLPSPVGATLLCVGIGTGNEVRQLLCTEGATRVVGIDLSRPALVRARKRGRRLGNRLAPARMDAQCLGLRPQTFDGALCLHTMDFLQDPSLATRELFRVLKPGGAFVISYPGGSGAGPMVSAVVRSIASSVRRGRVLAAGREALAGVGAGLVYLPLALTPGPRRKIFSRGELKMLLEGLRVTQHSIMEAPGYQDLIAWGKK